MGKKPLHILIDSGSTHNFIDESVVDKLKLCKDLIIPYSVTIADGNQLHCKAVCRDFSWRLQEDVFKSDVWVLPLGGCDMVLGIQWLKGLGVVK